MNTKFQFLKLNVPRIVMKTIYMGNECFILFFSPYAISLKRKAGNTCKYAKFANWDRVCRKKWRKTGGGNTNEQKNA